MKVPAFCLMVIVSTALSSRGQEAHDLRVVNGIAVDLGPLHTWFARREGERPLKHWKRVQILEIKERSPAWTKCVVRNEDAQQVTICLENLPATVQQHFAQVATASNAVRVLRAQISAAERQRNAAWDRYVYTPSSDFGVTSSSRGGTVVDNESTRLANARAMDARILVLRDQLDQAVATQQRLSESAPTALTVFAMYSGRNYVDVPLWNCGTKKQ